MENHNSKIDKNTVESGNGNQLPPFFSARLFPHRSLGQKGFILLMAFIAIICFGLGIFFWTIGAWPIFGFLGLDVLAIYFAFRINYRDARAFEEVTISREEMLVRKCNPRGRCKTWSFNPVWSRFSVNRHEEIGITRMEIISRKIRLTVGDFLNPDDRESFATAFGNALAKAKR